MRAFLVSRQTTIENGVKHIRTLYLESLGIRTRTSVSTADLTMIETESPDELLDQLAASKGVVEIKYGQMAPEDRVAVADACAR